MTSSSRRRFLKQASSIPAASTLLNLKLAGIAGAANAGEGDDRKALVCIHMDGGMDGYHLLMPRDVNRHADYAASRGNLHLPVEGSLGLYRQAMQPLNESDGGNGQDLYGVHYNAEEIAEMFNGTDRFQGKPCASFVGNVGTLIKPLTKDEFFSGQTGVDIPVGVGGHFRQGEQWKTAIPQGTIELRGWLGRAADLIHGDFNRADASMNISLSGNNLMQTGVDTRPFAYSFGLSRGLSTSSGGDDGLSSMKNLFHSRIHGVEHENFVDKAFAETSRLSLDKQIAIREADAAFKEVTLAEPFQLTSLDRSLKTALSLIYSAEKLGLCRQTFFITVPGWDDHGELPESFSGRISAVSESIARFQNNANALGISDKIIGFTTSEFARSLRSTGRGSDHAWGGPQMVFGGPVVGGKIFGQYPDLAFGSEFETGRGGRFSWFGVTEEQLNTVLPNWKYFAARSPVGYLK